MKIKEEGIKIRPKPISGRESAADILRRLKSEESTPLAKPFIPPSKKPTFLPEEKKIVVKEVEPEVIGAERLLRKIEDLEKKAKHGENYLIFYAEIKALEDQFLTATETINSDSKDTTISRLLLRRQMILRKRGHQK